MVLEILIEEVKQRPCLWKKSLEDYRNQNVRDNAWEQISKVLHRPADDLRADWKKLQDSYRQAMLRRRTKSGQAAKKMKVWKYELQMSFLLADTIPRRTDSNVATVQNEGDKEDDEDFVELNATGGGNEENEKEETDGGEDKAENEQEGRSRIFRKRNRKLVKENEQDVNKVISFMKERKQESKKLLGELDYFFASACESAKRLPRHLQLRVKREVMNTILNAETESLSFTPASVSAPSSATNISAPPSRAASSLTYNSYETEESYNNQHYDYDANYDLTAEGENNFSCKQ